MSNQINFSDLAAPFAPEDLEFRAGATTGDKTKALALAYITSRAVMNRLDDVVGPANWKDQYAPAPAVASSAASLCGLTANGSPSGTAPKTPTLRRSKVACPMPSSGLPSNGALVATCTLPPTCGFPVSSGAKPWSSTSRRPVICSSGPRAARFLKEASPRLPSLNRPPHRRPPMAAPSPVRLWPPGPTANGPIR